MEGITIATRNDWIVLLFFLAICFAVAGLGSIATSPEIPGWYASLKKPAWTPPNWLFGPVWTLLYAAMAVAAWLVWRRAGWQDGRAALTLFAIQLALNLAWSFIFFKLHRPGLAFAEIVLLVGAVAATMIKFAHFSNAAAILLAPYLLWIVFAAALNFAIWMLNR